MNIIGRRKIKIYVSYYDERQKALLANMPNDIFRPWDVSFNNKSAFLELDLFRTILKDGRFFEGADLVGIYSWKFLIKTGMPTKLLLQKINTFTEGDKDAMVINPTIANNAIFANPFEQGMVSGHGNMMKIIEKIGWGDIYRSFMRPNTFTMSSYIIGSRDFWWDLVFFLEGMVNKILTKAESDHSLKKLVYGSANYVRNPNLTYWPFLIERFISVFLEKTDYNYMYVHPNQSWMENKFPGNSELSNIYDLKKACYLDNYFYKEWQRKRMEIINNRSLLMEYFKRDDPEIYI